MAIADRINEMYTHVGDVYDTITNVDLPTNKNIQNIPQTIKDSYLEIMNNGIDTIWNNWEKVTGSGTSISLSPTLKAPMKNELKGNTSQTGTPTPTSPIPVNVVSGDNEINVVGKNLFDKTRLISGKRLDNTGLPSISDNTYCTTDYFIKVEPSTTYYSTSSINQSKAVCFYDSNQEFIERKMYLSSNTFTTGATTQFIKISILLSEIDTEQLEKGSSATTYEPYQGNTYNIDLPSGMELCKIGTYQDYFYKDSGKWYLHKEIGKVVLNGSENLELWGNFANKFSCKLSNVTNLINISNISQLEVLISNYFNKALSQGALFDNDIEGIATTQSNLYFKINKTTATDLATFKSWLSTHNTEVYYVLATPTNTEITDTTLINQLEQFYQAQSKNNQTNISQINNDLGFIISASALKKG